MKSVIFQAAASMILKLQLLLSLFLLLRGHNLPGGGFVGGLIAAAGFILYAMAFDVPASRQKLRWPPERFLGLGLLIAAGSGWIGPILQESFFKGVWFGRIDLPGMGKTAIGTPFFFDIGVYLVVIGMTVLVAFSLFEKNQNSAGENS